MTRADARKAAGLWPIAVPADLPRADHGASTVSPEIGKDRLGSRGPQVQADLTTFSPSPPRRNRTMVRNPDSYGQVPVDQFSRDFWRLNANVAKAHFQRLSYPLSTNDLVKELKANLGISEVIALNVLAEAEDSLVFDAEAGTWRLRTDDDEPVRIRPPRSRYGCALGVGVARGL
jgi:hypothetical protein